MWSCGRNDVFVYLCLCLYLCLYLRLYCALYVHAPEKSLSSKSEADALHTHCPIPASALVLLLLDGAPYTDEWRGVQ